MCFVSKKKQYVENIRTNLYGYLLTPRCDNFSIIAKQCQNIILMGEKIKNLFRKHSATKFIGKNVPKDSKHYYYYSDIFFVKLEYIVISRNFQ